MCRTATWTFNRSIAPSLPPSRAVSRAGLHPIDFAYSIARSTFGELPEPEIAITPPGLAKFFHCSAMRLQLAPFTVSQAKCDAADALPPLPQPGQGFPFNQTEAWAPCIWAFERMARYKEMRAGPRNCLRAPRRSGGGIVQEVVQEDVRMMQIRYRQPRRSR